MALPEKFRDVPAQPATRAHLIDRIFFGCATAASIWLAWALIDVTFGRSWWRMLLLIVFWLVLAYLALPRLNRILAAIYVPDYFIGRTRTSDGLLGDPLNLAVRGTAEQLATVMQRAGWTLADPVTLRSSVRIVTSTLTRRSYPEAPVSPLLLFGRPQDAAYQQEVEGNPAQRHHVRFWRTPRGWPLPGGHRVDWLAGGTYDRRVGLSLFTLQITHKIDADIDVERDFIVDSVTTAVPEVEVEPLVDFTTGYHSRNGGGDAVHTDGTLPILDLAAVTAAPDASSLTPAAPPMPFQVLLSAIAAMITAPVLVAAVAWNDRADGSAFVASGIALAVLCFALAVGVLRRVAWARWGLLTLALLTVLLRVTDYYAEGAPHLEVTFQAGTAILQLLGLSSPAAAAWTSRRQRVASTPAPL